MSTAGLHVRPTAAAVAAAAVLALGAGCERPVLSRDGQLVFQQKGAHGATVITANGVEFLDRAEIPQPVVRRSADEPWRPATGMGHPPGARIPAGRHRASSNLARFERAR